MADADGGTGRRRNVQACAEQYLDFLWDVPQILLAIGGGCGENFAIERQLA
jgi:hypothetical protein